MNSSFKSMKNMYIHTKILQLIQKHHYGYFNVYLKKFILYSHFLSVQFWFAYKFINYNLSCKMYIPHVSI